MYLCRSVEYCVNDRYSHNLFVHLEAVPLSLTLSAHTLTLTQPHLATPTAGVCSLSPGHWDTYIVISTLHHYPGAVLNDYICMYIHTCTHLCIYCLVMDGWMDGTSTYMHASMYIFFGHYNKCKMFKWLLIFQKKLCWKGSCAKGMYVHT